MIPAKLETLRSFLQSRNLKPTPQRRTVLEAFAESASPVRCEDLLKTVRKREPTIGLSTIYRTMKLLVQAGIAYGVHYGDGIFLHAQPCACGQELELRCTKCGQIIHISCTGLTEHIVRALEGHGCTLASQRHSLTGLCARCKDAR